MRTIALAASCLIACGDDQQPEEAAALLERIQADDYRAWDRAPGYDTRQPTVSAHADTADVFVNPIVAEALAGGAITEWPLGSLVVKDGYDGDDLELIAVMEKREDGWFWAEYYDGESKFSGKPDVCIDCHRPGDDFVRAFDFPR